MQFNRFTAAVLTAGALVLLSINTASAADGQFLADRHVARGVACASCHGKETPKAGAKVSTAQCNTCHQSLDVVAKQTSKLDPNPHYNHLVGLDCAECHRGHQQSVNMCAQCHNIEYKVPSPSIPDSKRLLLTHRAVCRQKASNVLHLADGGA